MSINIRRILAIIAVALVIAIIVLFPGDLITDWADVSDEADFQSLVGMELTSRVDLRAHGVTMEPDYEKVLDHYLVTVLPGIDGPEVLEIVPLPIGTKFRVVKVLRCVDCIFSYENIELLIIKGPALKDRPIWFGYREYSENGNDIFRTEDT